MGRGKAHGVRTILLPASATSSPINVSTAGGYVCVHLCIRAHVCPHTFADKHITYSLKHTLNASSICHQAAIWAHIDQWANTVQELLIRQWEGLFDKRIGEDWTSTRTRRWISKGNIGTLSKPRWRQTICSREQNSGINFYFAYNYQLKQMNANVSE